ncbi:MAG: hypothetical protein E7595_03085 [Ruminococcaceae bacterium]|nr:hypothetical protein [Oscillospiraceae bacterium]
MDKRKVIYYTDELNNEFSTAQIEKKNIDENYIYCHNSLFKRFTRFFWYRIIATPFAFIYTKISFGHRTFGRKKLNSFKGTGYFLYGNHTQDIGDAFLPTMINFPQSDYCIAHANNVSMPILGHITPSLGALPLPDDLKAYKNFISAINRRIGEGNTVVVYPEAHIWPYYTKIRPFTDVSFKYPVDLDTPVFCFTNTYKKRKLRRKPRIITYIDGPFYPDSTLSKRERRQKLRDEVYNAMCTRAKESDIEIIKYIKREQENG